MQSTSSVHYLHGILNSSVREVLTPLYNWGVEAGGKVASFEPGNKVMAWLAIARRSLCLTVVLVPFFPIFYITAWFVVSVVKR